MTKAAASKKSPTALYFEMTGIRLPAAAAQKQIDLLIALQKAPKAKVTRTKPTFTKAETAAAKKMGIPFATSKDLAEARRFFDTYRVG